MEKLLHLTRFQRAILLWVNFIGKKVSIQGKARKILSLLWIIVCCLKAILFIKKIWPF